MNHGDELKRFMLLIPKDLDDKNNVEVKKYTSSQLKALEEASEKMIPPKLAGHILFEEWSTSGKRRPNMGHLLNLLVEAELFRAADFVAMDLLEGELTLGATSTSSNRYYRYTIFSRKLSDASKLWASCTCRYCFPILERA